MKLLPLLTRIKPWTNQLWARKRAEAKTRQSPKKTSHKAENSTKHRHSLVGIQMRFNQKWKENNVNQASLVLCFSPYKNWRLLLWSFSTTTHFASLSFLIIRNRLQLSRRFLFLWFTENSHETRLTWLLATGCESVENTKKNLSIDPFSNG